MGVKEDRVARLDTIAGDINWLGSQAGLTGPNYYKEVYDDIEAGNHTNLLLVEAEVSKLELEETKQQNKETRKQNALLAKKVCDSVLLLVGGYTVEVNMPQGDVDTMIGDNQPLYEALQAGRATKAHSIVDSMVPSALIPQSLIDDIIEEFAPLGL